MLLAGSFQSPGRTGPFPQRIPFGTTAWRISMGRRQVVESVNAALKGAFVDLGRGSSGSSAAGEDDRDAGLHPRRLQPRPGFAASGPSTTWRGQFDVPSFIVPSRRAKRRIGTWDQVVEHRSKAPPG